MCSVRSRTCRRRTASSFTPARQTTVSSGQATLAPSASARALPFASIDDVFREVEAGAVHYGVVPVENSTEGVVGRTLSLNDEPNEEADPFWALVQESGVAVTLHASDSGYQRHIDEWEGGGRDSIDVP